MALENVDEVEEVRSGLKELEHSMAALLKTAGFKKSGQCFWRTSQPLDAFAGFVIGVPPGRGKSKRLTFDISLHGGRLEFHRLNPGRELLEFKPSMAASQFRSYLMEDGYNKQWTLFPSTDVEKMFAEISVRVTSELFPLVEAILTKDGLTEALNGRRLYTFSPALTEGVISALQMTKKREP